MADKSINYEDQQYDFKLPNNAVVQVSVGEDGKLRVCGISKGTKLAVEPITQNSFTITAIQRAPCPPKAPKAPQPLHRGH